MDNISTGSTYFKQIKNTLEFTQEIPHYFFTNLTLIKSSQLLSIYLHQMRILWPTKKRKCTISLVCRPDSRGRYDHKAKMAVDRPRIKK